MAPAPYLDMIKEAIVCLCASVGLNIVKAWGQFSYLAAIVSTSPWPGGSPGTWNWGSEELRLATGLGKGGGDRIETFIGTLELCHRAELT